MAHHTKDKGDLAVGMVIADLLINGYHYSPLISEHMPFDLIAINPHNDYQLKKIQVKYSSLKDGTVLVKLANSYADTNGVYTRTIDRSHFDAYAIFCGELNKIYYVKCNEIPITSKRGFSLRVEPPKTRMPTVNFARDYLRVARIFE
jgi:hypothetical protein